MSTSQTPHFSALLIVLSSRVLDFNTPNSPYPCNHPAPDGPNPHSFFDLQLRNAALSSEHAKFTPCNTSHAAISIIPLVAETLAIHSEVESGAVIGIELDPSSQEGDCNACIFVCATHLPVPKVQISSPAQNFRDEVHTDVWGLAMIATCQNRRYFVTFMDDATRYTVTYLL